MRANQQSCLVLFPLRRRGLGGGSIRNPPPDPLPRGGEDHRTPIDGADLNWRELRGSGAPLIRPVNHSVRPTLIGLLMLALLSSTATLRAATLNGYVRDAETKETLVRVTVSIKNTTLGAYTNKSGFYVVKNIP